MYSVVCVLLIIWCFIQKFRTIQCFSFSARFKLRSNRGQRLRGSCVLPNERGFSLPAALVLAVLRLGCSGFPPPVSFCIRVSSRMKPPAARLICCFVCACVRVPTARTWFDPPRCCVVSSYGFRTTTSERVEYLCVPAHDLHSNTPIMYVKH